jgi:hypothetical protein
LTTERHSAQEALAMVAQIPVQTPEQREQVGLMIKAAGQRVKELDEQRKGVTGKLREAVKMIDGWFAPPKELWSQIKVGLQQRLDGELARLEAERQAAARAIAAGQAETADYVAYHTDVSAPSTVRTLSRITFAVPDSTLVPDEYWCLDYDKIDRAVKAGLLDDAPWVTVIRERVSGAK